MTAPTTVLGCSLFVNSDTCLLVQDCSTGISQRLEDIFTGAAVPAGNLTIEFNNAGTRTFTLQNSGAGVANLTVDGTITGGKAVIPTGGGLAVGTTAPTNRHIITAGAVNTPATTEVGIDGSITGSGSTNTSVLTGLRALATTPNSAYTTTVVAGLYVPNVVKGAAHTIGTAAGVYVDPITAAASVAAGMVACLPTGGTVANRGLWVPTSAAAATTNTGAYIGAPTGAGTTNEGVYVETPSGAGTNKTINTNSGAGTPAYLTTGGTWTNASSWAAGKELKGPPDEKMVREWADWLLTEKAAPQMYRYPTICYEKGEVLPHDAPCPSCNGEGCDPCEMAGRVKVIATGKEVKVGGHQPGDHDTIFPILDTMPESLRNAITTDAGGGIGTKDFDGVMYTLVRHLMQRLTALEQQ